MLLLLIVVSKGLSVGVGRSIGVVDCLLWLTLHNIHVLLLKVMRGRWLLLLLLLMLIVLLLLIIIHRGLMLLLWMLWREVLLLMLLVAPSEARVPPEVIVLLIVLREQKTASELNINEVTTIEMKRHKHDVLPRLHSHQMKERTARSCPEIPLKEKSNRHHPDFQTSYSPPHHHHPPSS